MNPKLIVRAVEELALLKFFPSGPGEREAVMRLLEKIADRPERLRWLVDTLVNYIGEWPGPAQVRALYATRWKPLDGVEGAYCTIVGFTPADSEAASLEAHQGLKIAPPWTGPGLKRLKA